jgi:glycosyltransferase involved in cell wall biosynthesis
MNASNDSSNGLSVVIPTFNRGKFLAETLRACAKVARGLPVEFIVIDDGSRDDTPQRLAELSGEMPNLRWQSIPNGGPGPARNLGASLATKDIVMFQGDDIRPCDKNFYRVHLEAHAMFPTVTSAVQGKAIWPSGPDADVNFVMQHVQGPSCEQFCYYCIEPYRWLDYRFFYTCNVSVKRRLIGDWMTEGFSPAFRTYGYEDTEFAYRLQKSREFSTLYVPASVGEHWHQYSLETFINRQFSAGTMLKVLLEKHPELSETFADYELIEAMASDHFRDDAEMLAHVTGVFEGIKSLAKLLSYTQRLGSQNWHHELLSAVFRLAHSEGVMMAYATPTSNLVAARLKALENFQAMISHSLSREILGKESLRQLFRRKLARVPTLRPTYRMARRILNAIHLG